jgi:hypothetical protein
MRGADMTAHFHIAERRSAASLELDTLLELCRRANPARIQLPGWRRASRIEAECRS